MKKLFILLIVCCVLALAFPVSNLLAGAPDTPLASLETQDARLAQVAHIFAEKCSNCHVEAAARPWYAGLPVASAMVQADTTAGLRAVDLLAALTPENGAPVGEVALAKIEHAIAQDLMPPARFKAVHWGTGLSDSERELIAGWVAEVRAANYRVDGVAEAYASGPVQPLPRNRVADAAKVNLGNALYHDVRLSGDNTLSCASCHGLDEGGCDQLPVSEGIAGQKGPINAPTVFNSAYQFAMFWDGRMSTLKEQAGGPVENPLEMGAKWADVLPKLAADPAFMAQFSAIYPELNDENVRDAIAEFEKSLVTPDSPFDRFLRGEESALSDEAKHGYTLFVESGCAACHTGKILGGQSYEPMGYRKDYFGSLKRELTDADAGRYNFTKNEADRGKFKVPTLLNVALTHPYFHDAATDNLREAVAIMVEYNAGITLGDGDLDALTAFLESLTGKYDGKPLVDAV
jgi:cytochrome c peroxidase